MGEAQDWFTSAASGDLESIRMLRDGIMEMEGLPVDERLAQAEVIARMAAQVGGPWDKLSLSAVLFLRASHLMTLRDVCQSELERSTATGSESEASRWAEMAETHNARANRYKTEGEDLYPEIMCGDDPAAAAHLAAALTSRADAGDDEALGLLQQLIDALPSENLGALRAALRTLEQELDA